MKARTMEVPFFGGSGTISAVCVRRALALNMDVPDLNRGWSVPRVHSKGRYGSDFACGLLSQFREAALPSARCFR